MDVSHNQELVVSKGTKLGTQVDRVILGKSEATLLAKWVEDFNLQADGLVKVSKADLVNYLIASHAAKISSEEICDIAARYYDETRWLGWSVAKMKEAKKKGLSLLFDDLMKFRDEFLGKVSIVGKKKKTSSKTEMFSESSNLQEATTSMSDGLSKISSSKES